MQILSMNKTLPLYLSISFVFMHASLMKSRQVLISYIIDIKKNFSAKKKIKKRKKKGHKL